MSQKIRLAASAVPAAAYAATICLSRLRWIGVADWSASSPSFMARCEIARRRPYLTPLNHIAAFDLLFGSTHVKNNLISAEPCTSNLALASCITAPRWFSADASARKLPVFRFAEIL